MPALFHRHSNVVCFFCQNAISPLPRDLRNFRCSICGCWNRLDEDGNILSDDPAMHDASLNIKSFSKRASPSKDRLPTMYGKGPFCHTCQTNQMLLVNLLSNYLPPHNDPEYAHRLEMLPEYKESLHLRYPPVCDACLPAVEEEIRKKDHMARTKALGGWLQESKGKEKQRRASDTPEGKERFDMEIIAWKLRGVLWAITFSLALVVNSIGTLGYLSEWKLIWLQPFLPVIVLISLLWTVWDPTYLSFRRAQRQGRAIRIRGKREYIVLQMIAWLSREVTSLLWASVWYDPNLDCRHLFTSVSRSSRMYFSLSLLLELTTFVMSCIVLRLQHPPAVRLLDTNSHKTHFRPATTTPSVSRSGTPAYGSPSVPESDPLPALSLSTNPIITPTNPVFGLPSLLSVPLPSAADKEVDANAMDWTPTGVLPEQHQQEFTKQLDDGSWLRPQRFFAPEKPTGLEGLFERALLVNDPPSDSTDDGRNRSYITNHARNWWWAYALSFAPILAIAYKAWESVRRNL